MIATLARFDLSLSPQHDRLPAGGVRFTAVRLFRMNRLLSASPRFKCCLRTICRLRNRGLISGGRIGERDEELGGSRGARARLPAPAPGPRGPVPPGSLSALGVAAVITAAPIRGALGLAETSVCGGAQRLPATHAPPRSRPRPQRPLCGPQTRRPQQGQTSAVPPPETLRARPAEVLPVARPPVANAPGMWR